MEGNNVSNETTVEDGKTKWYNTTTMRVSIGAVCLGAGLFVFIIAMKKRNAAIKVDSNEAKDALKYLADLGARSLDDAGEKLSDLAD